MHSAAGDLPKGHGTKVWRQHLTHSEGWDFPSLQTSLGFLIFLSMSFSLMTCVSPSFLCLKLPLAFPPHSVSLPSIPEAQQALKATLSATPKPSSPHSQETETLFCNQFITSFLGT